MTIDFWELGLQAVNVMILVWLLSRVFWRPVARAITTRQDMANAIMVDAEAARTEADAALADVASTRKCIASEREAAVTDATEKAEEAMSKALREAQQKAVQLVDAAQVARDREGDAARKVLTVQAAELAVDIAMKLLKGLDAPVVQKAFLASLVDAVAAMDTRERAALLESTSGIDLVSAADLDDAERAQVEKAVGAALGGVPKLNFLTAPDLIAGHELRTAHFVLHNSWRSGLDGILKDLKHVS